MGCCFFVFVLVLGWFFSVVLYLNHCKDMKNWSQCFVQWDRLDGYFSTYNLCTSGNSKASQSVLWILCLPTCTKQNWGGGGGEKRSSKKKSRFTFFCYLVNIESIYIVLQLKLEKHWNRWSLKILCRNHEFRGMITVWNEAKKHCSCVSEF